VLALLASQFKAVRGGRSSRKFGHLLDWRFASWQGGIGGFELNTWFFVFVAALLFRFLSLCLTIAFRRC
jgi:hypothetical protein